MCRVQDEAWSAWCKGVEDVVDYYGRCYRPTVGEVKDLGHLLHGSVQTGVRVFYLGTELIQHPGGVSITITIAIAISITISITIAITITISIAITREGFLHCLLVEFIGDVVTHVPERRPCQDVSQGGFEFFSWSAGYLKVLYRGKCIPRAILSGLKNYMYVAIWL